MSFNDFNSQQGFLRISNFTVLLCIVVHSITCFFYLLATNEDIDFSSTYISTDQLNKEQVYVKTLYYVITTISTVGYGDIFPQTSKEIAYVMFVQFIGVMIFAYLTGSITSILMNLNQREKMLSDNEISLDKWFLDLNSQGKFRVSNDLQKNIKDYFVYFWKNDHSSLLNETGYLMRMPIGLRNEFIDFLFSDEIENFNVFFNEYEKQLRYLLMLSMYPRLFEENEVIIKNSVLVEEIYIIRRGKVNLQTPSGINFLALSDKSFFGEEFVLFSKIPKLNFSADVFGVECFCIKRNKYLELLHKYPKTFQSVLRRAFKRAKYFKAVMRKILSKDEIGNDELFGMRSTSIRAESSDFINNFSWDLNEQENEELNGLIIKANEITVKEKICENLKVSQQSMKEIYENVEKISEKMEEIKSSYENDVTSLILAVNLLRDGHQIEANDIISRIMNKGNN